MGFGTVLPVWLRGRSARSSLALIAVIATISIVASAFASSPASIVSIPTDGVTRGEPHSAVRLAAVATSHLVGQECTFVLSSTNTHHRSLHEHTLVLTIAGEGFKLRCRLACRRAADRSTGPIRYPRFSAEPPADHGFRRAT